MVGAQTEVGIGTDFFWLNSLNVIIQIYPKLHVFYLLKHVCELNGNNYICTPKAAEVAKLVDALL